jgi:hypothetical protein
MHKANSRWPPCRELFALGVPFRSHPFWPQLHSKNRFADAVLSNCILGLPAVMEDPFSHNTITQQ